MRALVFLLAVASAIPAAEDDLNFFEWTGVSPIVIAGYSVGSSDALHEFVAEQVFRGDVVPGATVRVDLRQANHARSINADPQRLKFEEGQRYLLLLEPGHSTKAQAKGALWLVRGVRGARPVPSEGGPALFDAIRTFVDIQDSRSHELTWRRFGDMLEESNPVLLETALAQFQKFRRGEPELIPVLRPLLDHPLGEIRRETAVLLGQILERNRDQELPDEAAVLGDLAGKARRDERVDVRVAATEALGVVPGPGTRRVLEEVAADDPDQLVRFAAEKILLDRRRAAAESS